MQRCGWTLAIAGLSGYSDRTMEAPEQGEEAFSHRPPRAGGLDGSSLAGPSLWPGSTGAASCRCLLLAFGLFAASSQSGPAISTTFP